MGEIRNKLDEQLHGIFGKSIDTSLNKEEFSMAMEVLLGSVDDVSDDTITKIFVEKMELYDSDVTITNLVDICSPTIIKKAISELPYCKIDCKQQISNRLYDILSLLEPDENI
jgi:hypothetical protein